MSVRVLKRKNPFVYGESIFDVTDETKQSRGPFAITARRTAGRTLEVAGPAAEQSRRRPDTFHGQLEPGFMSTIDEAAIVVAPDQIRTG
jgi:hypothetical protein